jgi:hypothetical protein
MNAHERPTPSQAPRRASIVTRAERTSAALDAFRDVFAHLRGVVVEASRLIGSLVVLAGCIALFAQVVGL